MIDFDPWTATDEEARKCDESLTRKIHEEVRDGIKTSRFYRNQRFVAQRILGLKEAVESGDRFLAQAAMDYCLRHRLPIPDWLQEIFDQRYDEISAFRGLVGANDDRAVMDGIVRCLELGLVPPDWLLGAFLRRYNDVVRYKFGSWDDVFGKPHRNSAKIRQLRIHHEQAFAVFWRARDLLEGPNPPAKTRVFERIANEFATTRNTVIRMIKKVEEEYGVSLEDRIG